MKKIILLSFVIMLTITTVFATYMNVENFDGSIFSYDVENVGQVYFSADAEGDTIQNDIPTLEGKEVTVHDTTIVKQEVEVPVHDTTVITQTDTLEKIVRDTIQLVQHDTTIVRQEVEVPVHDTTIITQTDTLEKIVRDTIQLVQHDTTIVRQEVEVPVHDTTVITKTDTLEKIVRDTIKLMNYDTTIVRDTIVETVKDTIVQVIHDTVRTGVLIDNVSVTGKTEKGRYYVDLGLPSGTKWATCNFCAEKPTQYGCLVAWGETKPKKNKYDWENYKLCWGNDEKTIIRYCDNSFFGKVDNQKVLSSQDDAVTNYWGKQWRMPTAEEMQELIDGCTWKWVANFHESEVAGYVGTSRVNGNIIFLPAGGFRENRTTMGVDTFGDYWSASLSENRASFAQYLSFNCLNINMHDADRYYGHSIRAVLREE